MFEDDATQDMSADNVTAQDLTAQEVTAHDLASPDLGNAATFEPPVKDTTLSDATPPLTIPPTPSSPPWNPTKSKKSVSKVVGIGLGVVGLLGGAAFAVTQINGGEKANTPEEAVQTFLSSFETGDLIGMAKLLAPGERDIMLDSMVPMASELSRLDILDKNLDLAKVPGYDAQVTDYKATSKQLRPDLAEVTVTGGRIKTSFDPSKLPIGQFVRDLVGDQLKTAKPTSSSTDLKTDSSNSPLIVQRIGKRWYISLNYSVAEAARRGASKPYPVPAKGSGVPAKGADSAEAAVSEMIVAAAHFDARRMLELLPPDEFAALHDYSKDLLTAADDSSVQARRDARIDVTPKLATARITDDRALVTILDLPATLKINSNGTLAEATYANKEFSGKVTTDKGETVKADFKKDCLTLVVDADTKKGCGTKEIVALISEISGQPIDTTQLSTGGLGLGRSCSSVKKARPKIGFIAVKREGKWFVSPIRTSLDAMTAFFKQVDRKDLDCIRKQIETAVNSVRGTVGAGASDSTFEAPTDPSRDPFSTDVVSSEVPFSASSSDAQPSTDTLG